MWFLWKATHKRIVVARERTEIVRTPSLSAHHSKHIHKALKLYPAYRATCQYQGARCRGNLGRVWRRFHESTAAEVTRRHCHRNIHRIVPSFCEGEMKSNCHGRVILEGAGIYDGNCFWWILFSIFLVCCKRSSSKEIYKIHQKSGK